MKKNFLITSFLSLLILLNTVSNIYCIKIDNLGETDEIIEIEPASTIDLLSNNTNLEIYNFMPNTRYLGSFDSKQRDLEEFVTILEKIDSKCSITYLKAIFELGKLYFYNQDLNKAYRYLKEFLDNYLHVISANEKDFYLMPRLVAIAHCYLGQILLKSYDPEDYLLALEHFDECIYFENSFYSSEFIIEDLDDIKRYLDITHDSLLNYSQKNIQEINIFKNLILNFIQLKKEKNNIDTRSLINQYEQIIEQLYFLLNNGFLTGCDSNVFAIIEISICYKITKICLLNFTNLKKANNYACKMLVGITNLDRIKKIKLFLFFDILKKMDKDLCPSCFTTEYPINIANGLTIEAAKNFNSLFFKSIEEKEKYFNELNTLKQEIDSRLASITQEQVV
ncbi:hypothetical protein K9L05_00775 [Candidatus Babeliales bacterium]|nr:hypothetical protein [Candidatus Babeliales bacterium]MCF7899167.1 hypothetical protein [Candidatus Babeliales bacterium]